MVLVAGREYSSTMTGWVILFSLFQPAYLLPTQLPSTLDSPTDGGVVIIVSAHFLYTLSVPPFVEYLSKLMMLRVGGSATTLAD